MTAGRTCDPRPPGRDGAGRLPFAADRLPLPEAPDHAAVPTDPARTIR